MSDQAANSAAQPNSSLKAPSVAMPSREGRDGTVLDSHPQSESWPAEMGRSSDELLIAGTRRVTSVHWEFFRLVSRPLLGITLRGLSGAQRLGALLLRLRRPAGYGFRLRRTLRKCRAWHLGAGPTR